MAARTDFRKTEFARFTEGFSGFHFATELLGHGLHAIADAQHRHAEFKHRLRCAWRIAFGHGARSAGKDDAFRAIVSDEFVGDVVRINFGKHAGITHTAGDELGDLGTEINDEDFIVMVTHIIYSIKNVYKKGGQRPPD